MNNMYLIENVLYIKEEKKMKQQFYSIYVVEKLSR